MCRHGCRDNDGDGQQLQCKMALVVVEDARYHQSYSPEVRKRKKMEIESRMEV